MVYFVTETSTVSCQQLRISCGQSTIQQYLTTKLTC